MNECNSKYCGCLYYAVSALSRVLTRVADEEFAKTGLQSSSYAFLIMTVNATPGIHPKEIASEMQLTPSTVTRLIEKMEQRGFIERRQAGRSTNVFPTEQAKNLDGEIKAAWQRLHKRYADFIGEEESSKLTDDCMKMYNKIR